MQKGHGVCQPSMIGFNVALEWNLFTEKCCQKVTNSARPDTLGSVFKEFSSLRYHKTKLNEHKNYVGKKFLFPSQPLNSYVEDKTANFLEYLTLCLGN